MLHYKTNLKYKIASYLLLNSLVFSKVKNAAAKSLTCELRTYLCKLKPTIKYFLCP